MDLNNHHKTAWMLWLKVENTPSHLINPDIIQSWLEDIYKSDEDAINDTLANEWPDIFPKDLRPPPE